MKKKFSKILGVGLIVALVVSLVVIAAPVAAQTYEEACSSLEVWGSASASWVVEPQGRAETLTTMGEFSPELTCTDSGSDFSMVKVPYPQPLSSVSNDKLGFDYWTDTTGEYPAFALLIDSGGGSVPDVILFYDEKPATQVLSTWTTTGLYGGTKWTAAGYDPTAAYAGGFGYDPPPSYSPYDTLAYWQ